MHDTIVRDVTVYSGGSWLSHRDIVFDAGVVTDIRDASLSGGGGTDGSGAYLVPGFVNTHTHMQQSLMRGIAEGTPLLEWLLAVAEDSVAITPERAYTATVAASLEALRSGTTTLVEHMWPHPSTEVHEAVIRGLHDTGIRAVLGRGTADRADPTRRWGFDPRLMQPLTDVLDHLDELMKVTAGKRISPAVAVPNPRSLTPDGMAAVSEFARCRDMTVMIHLLETHTDDAMCREHTGVGAVEYLDRHGFLDDRVLAVHCVELDAEGRTKLAQRGVGISYNPLSNMRLGSGVAAVPDMLAAGLHVGLGVDGAASNDTQDMLETMRVGAYVQRAVNKKADLLGFDAMIDMASGGANAALGLPPRAGGVAVGDVADLTMVRFERDFACLPVRDPGASLLTTGTRQVVDTVWVDGEVVIRDGRSTRVDEEGLVAALREIR